MTKAQHVIESQYHRNHAQLHDAMRQHHLARCAECEAAAEDEFSNPGNQKILKGMAADHSRLAVHHASLAELHKRKSDYHKGESERPQHQLSIGSERTPVDENDGDIERVAKAVLAKLGDQLVPSAISSVVPTRPGFQPGHQAVERFGMRPVGEGLATAQPHVSLEFEKLFSVTDS
jgi:hypothetical protein